MNIDEIMQLFQREPFWGLDKVKRPEPALLERFVSQYDLPEDYIRLLSISDGFVLFHAGDYRISDISWTVECYTNPVYGGGTFVDSILEVGMFMENSLLLDQSRSHTANYLFIGDADSTDHYLCVGTITDFLNQLIEEKGEIPFWEAGQTELFSFGAPEPPPSPDAMC